MVVLPEEPLPHPAGLTLAAGLAVLRAVSAAGVRGARLKWPNDVMVRGAKLAGILVEAPGALARPGYAVGIGVNVGQRAFPAALAAERAVTSVALEGGAAEVEELLERLLAELGPALETLRDRPRELEAAYLEATGLAGREVEVRSGERVTRGRWVGISLVDGVELETGGARTRLPVGHVTAIEAAS